MIAHFLSTLAASFAPTLNYVQNQHQLIALISCFGTPLMLMLYLAFKEKYKYIGEYSPNNNNLFEIGAIATLISCTFFYIVYDEAIIKAFFAMILFIMFIMSIMVIFDLLINKDKDNANLYTIILCLLFLFFIVTVIVAFMMFISMNNIDCSDCVKWM